MKNKSEIFFYFGFFYYICNLNNIKMHKFQKVRLEYNGISIDYDWMLVIESIEDLVNYHEKMMEAKMHDVWENLLETQEGKSHIDNNLGRLILFAADRADGKKSLIELTGIVSGEILSAKMGAILKYGKIYISKVGGFFPHSDSITVLEETIIEDNRLVFPQYTKEDIRIKQWEGGKHYYAYVGDFQVTDIDGYKKWDSKEEAMQKAKWYLYKLKNEQYKIKA